MEACCRALRLVLFLVWMGTFSRWQLVSGESCSALATAADGQDLNALRSKTIQAFRRKCRQRTSSCSFTTEAHDPPTIDFVFEPITCGHFHVDFELKARYDGVLALARTPDDHSLFALIIIGGWANTKSAILPYRTETFTEIMAEHDEAGILDPSALRAFWVGYADGTVSVGKGGEQRAFMEWDAAAYHGSVPHTIYLGISTWRSTGGEWVFYQFCP